jgi:hypothetical protein
MVVIMNNPPAFPCGEYTSTGMTLRDYFAAKAMQGMMVDTEIPNCTHIAKESYRMADAMLKAREA